MCGKRDPDRRLTFPWRTRVVMAVLTVLAMVGAGHCTMPAARPTPRTIAKDAPQGPRQPLLSGGLAPAATTRHYGLFSDQGLPLLTVNGAVPGDKVIVGAGTKAHRFAYLLGGVGLAYFNDLPECLASRTKVYGTNWWLLSDWRACVFPSAPDSPGRIRITFTNGLEFIECRALAQPGLFTDYACPERPEMRVKGNPSTDGSIHLLSPDGWDREFDRGDARWDPEKGIHLALARERPQSVSGAVHQNDPEVKAYERMPGEDRKIRNIRIYRPARQEGVQTEQQVFRFQYRDMNRETDDCDLDEELPQNQQCGGDYCYQRRCGLDRSADGTDLCYAYLCQDTSTLAYVSPWVQLLDSYRDLLATMYPEIVINKCKSTLCGDGPNRDACWDNRQPCSQARPVDHTDWKLWRLFAPEPTYPGSKVPLVYTFSYTGLAGRDAKILSLIEDNRGGYGSDTYPPSETVSSGNVIQLSYDKMNFFGRALKGVSFEVGGDRSAMRFQFSGTGLIRRIWGRDKEPYAIDYDVNETTGDTLVEVIDPEGARTEYDLKCASNCTACDASTGCNSLYVVRSVTNPNGMRTRFEYDADGRSTSITPPDGMVTKTEWESVPGLPDPLAKRIKKTSTVAGSSPCFATAFEYDDPYLFATPTATVVSVRGRETMRREQSFIAPSSDEPWYEWGKPRRTMTRLIDSNQELVATRTASAAGGQYVTSYGMKTSAGLDLTLEVKKNRDAVFGVARAVQRGGASGGATRAPERAAPPEVCNSRSDACPGALKAKATNSIQQRNVFPEAPAAGFLEALAASKLQPPGADATDLDDEETADLSDDDVLTSTANEPEGKVTTSTKYNADGTLAETAEERNGIRIRQVFTYHPVRMPVPDEDASGGVRIDKRNHPGAVETKKVFVGDELIEGQWWDYPHDQEGFVTQTKLGPTATGSFNTDGSRAAPTFTRKEHPWVDRLFYVGCPELVVKNVTVLPFSCRSSLDCQCGATCNLEPQIDQWGFTYGYIGTCSRASVAPLPQNFTCVRTFIGDPYATRDRFYQTYTKINSPRWFAEQCTIDNCTGYVNTLCEKLPDERWDP